MRTPDRYWDIFCRVVDNYGDIGVCWRLAQQLAQDYALPIRLWVDDLVSFAHIECRVQSHLPKQTVDGITIYHWVLEQESLTPGEVVIEAFACGLSDAFLQAMARCQPPPQWINLEYLSAEAWVEGCHLSQSQHPRLPLQQTFFFPGFSSNTGGVLGSDASLRARDAFLADALQQADFWQQLGLLAPAVDELTISVFTYEPPALVSWLQVLEHSPQPVRLLIPNDRTARMVAAYYEHPFTAGACLQRGKLTLHNLAFGNQAFFDRLLWSCDINFVRGEDSFVRAQWAAKPFFWHIYPTEDGAHWQKLEAFWQGYSASLPADLQQLGWSNWHWLNADMAPEVGQLAMQWQTWLNHLPQWQRHARDWQRQLSQHGHLAANLVRWVRR